MRRRKPTVNVIRRMGHPRPAEAYKGFAFLLIASVLCYCILPVFQCFCRIVTVAVFYFAFKSHWSSYSLIAPTVKAIGSGHFYLGGRM